MPALRKWALSVPPGLMVGITGCPARIRPSAFPTPARSPAAGERVLKTGPSNAVSEIPASASNYLSVALTSGRLPATPRQLSVALATAVGHSRAAAPSVVDTHR